MKVALDIGCSDVKLSYFNDKKEIICKVTPSLVRSGKASVNISGKSGFTYQADDEDWSVNDDYLNSEDTRFSSYQFSSLNRVLMVHALYQHLPDKQRFEVATGLPVDQYFVNGVVSEKNIDLKHVNVEKSVESKHFKKNVKSRNVCPEAVSAWVDICFDNKGKQVQKITQPVAIVDIGGRTTDVAIVTPDFSIEPSSTGTLKVGILDAYNLLNTKLMAQHYLDTNIDIFVLSEAFKSNEIQIDMSKVRDISKLVKEIKQSIASKILREVERKIDKVPHLQGICFVGGGAEALRQNLKTLGGNIFIPRDAVFSNCRGYLKILHNYI